MSSLFNRILYTINGWVHGLIPDTSTSLKGWTCVRISRSASIQIPISQMTLEFLILLWSTMQLLYIKAPQFWEHYAEICATSSIWRRHRRTHKNSTETPQLWWVMSQSPLRHTDFLFMFCKTISVIDVENVNPRIIKVEKAVIND
jgi:hypothetical protein